VEGQSGVTGQRQRTLSLFSGALIQFTVQSELYGGLIPSADCDVGLCPCELDLFAWFES
jgi:hypothetical protein